MTVDEMLTRFLTSKRAAGAAEPTLRWYSVQLGLFVRWLESQPDQTLTAELIENYLVHMRVRRSQIGDRRLSPASISSGARALRSFFAWGKAKGLLVANPMADIRLKKPAAKEPRQAMRGEIDTLIRSIPLDNWVGLRDYLVVHVAFFCGLRVGEIVLLETQHFDIHQEVLRLPGGKTGGGVVPLIRDVIEAFMSYEHHRPAVAERRLFLSSDGHQRPLGPLTENGIRQMLKRRCKEAGLRYLNPHSMRHGLAMFLLNERRVDASLVQRILRHSNIRTTMGTYARWTQDAMADEFRRKMER